MFIIVFGINLLLSKSGPLNSILLWLKLINEPLILTHNMIGVLIAETYFILPYAVLILVPALDRIDPTLATAARGLGASRWVAFRRITLPLSLPGVAVAGQLCLEVWGKGCLRGACTSGRPRASDIIGLGAAPGDRIQRLAPGRGNRRVDGAHGCRVRGCLCLTGRLAQTSRRCRPWVNSPRAP